MKCDKLNAYKADVTIPVYGTIADAQVYLKSEADKVVAKLKVKLVEQTTLRVWAELQLRHQKYKRCMAMHDYCLCELEFAFRDPCIERSTEGCVRWRKWANLWLELAEKFKEAK